jgi:hypothetical protein
LFGSFVGKPVALPALEVDHCDLRASPVGLEIERGDDDGDRVSAGAEDGALRKAIAPQVSDA